MNDDLISRQALLDEIEPYTDDVYNSTAREVKEIIEGFPSVNEKSYGELLDQNTKLISENFGLRDTVNGLENNLRRCKCEKNDAEQLLRLEKTRVKDLKNTIEKLKSTQNNSNDFLVANTVQDSERCKKVVLVECDANGNMKREEYEVVSEENEILLRCWKTSNGETIRDWSCNEYIRWNPENKKVLPFKIGDKTIDVEAHCCEFQRVYAIDKNGEKHSSFIQCVDYSNKQ